MAVSSSSVPQYSGIPRAEENAVLRIALAAVGLFSSLRLTVSLLGLSIVLIMAGTLAQEELNLLQVKQRYFTCWIAQLHFEDLVPQVFYKHDPLKGWIPFPGGKLIGTLLLINLLAAKITRFHARATGMRLGLGLLSLAVGFAMMLLVIFSGSSSEGVQGEPPISYSQMWYLLCAMVAVGGAALVAYATTATTKAARIMSGVGAFSVAVLLIGMLAGYFTLSEPGLRITWQLLKGTGVALIMMLGCQLIFAKQGGNVLLHFGVALLMVGQFAYGDRQLEQKLTLVENEYTNTLINLDAIELTFQDKRDPDETQIVAIPNGRLMSAAKSRQAISAEDLPVDVRVIQYMVNSKLVDPKDRQENPATAGIGLDLMAESTRMEGGASSKPNVASAYVELLSKEDGQSLGVYLFSQFVNDARSLFATDREDEQEQITVGDTTYSVGLRFQRVVKPYWVKLIDVRRNDYAGATTAQSFSSVIRLIDPRNDEDRQERIWMNNPLRYRGETFYQADYIALPGGKERTGLQVVQNSGWLIPYLACSITGVGMLFHFGGTLRRYLARRERKPRQTDFYPIAMALSLVFVGAMVTMKLVPWSAVSLAMQPDKREVKFDFYRAGELPVQSGGRLMPLDTYARLTLKTLSSKESLPLSEAPTELINRAMGRDLSPSELERYRSPRFSEKRLSALQWLMEVAGDSDQILDLPMIRIDAAELLAEANIERRRKSKLYTLRELAPSSERIREQATAANQKDSADLSFKERKTIELASRLHLFDVVSLAMQMPRPRAIPEELLPPGIDEETKAMLSFQDLKRRMDMIGEIPSPGMIPQLGQTELDRHDRKRWQPISNSFFTAIKDRLRDEQAEDPTKAFMGLVAAYQDKDAAKFNQSITKHIDTIRPRLASDETGWRIPLERWLEVAWPSGTAMILYLVALGMGLLFLLFNSGLLRASTWAMLLGILLLHTAALVIRIMITGRPPVINLYSSAVFIGWASVLFGIVIEYLGRRGVGNLVAASTGAITLMIATRGLSDDDTMPVLQAVLDTQFWLGTHVTTVTLGYAATFVAGMLGILYLVQSWTNLRLASLQEVYRMTYGVTCFAILFSFIGTVLGGLWADDSWGRFWGWDPKENGALLIVIWSALMLHARWDKMVGPHGFATLAVGGNIITAWSWFGTNQLGFGLHSYGFTSGTLMWLGLFVASQLAIIALAWLIGPRGKSASDTPNETAG